MKFKTITPGMVIHCPTEEDARALLEHLEELDYKWINGNKPTKNNTPFYVGYYRIRDAKLFCIECGIIESKITEFSDLIEPEPDSNASSNVQMSAVEVLEWFTEADYNVLAEIFDDWRNVDDILGPFTPSEIIDKITAYEAAKAQKPVEVEEGYRCYIYRSNVGRTVNEYVMWGVDEQTAKDDVIDKASKHTKETGEQVFAGVDFVCRVKEG